MEGSKIEVHGYAVLAENIPAELKERDQWVVWRYGARGNRVTKLPHRPSGQPAGADDPATWSTFDKAYAAYLQYPQSWGGIGYVFASHDPYCGVDLDMCVSPDRSTVTEWAGGAMDLLKSYAEISPSRRGIKIVAKGRFPIPDGKTGRTYRKLPSCNPADEKKAELAVWNERRYFAFTGNVFGGRLHIAKCQAGIDELYRIYWPEKISAAEFDIPPQVSLLHGGSVRPACLAAMHKSTAAMIDNSDGSRRLFTVACRATEWGLTLAESVATIEAYAYERPFPKAWTRAEIITRVNDAAKQAGQVSEFQGNPPRTELLPARSR